MERVYLLALVLPFTRKRKRVEGPAFWVRAVADRSRWSSKARAKAILFNLSGRTSQVMTDLLV